MNELRKLKEFTFEETLKLVKIETPEFLAEYIYKINHVYNLMLERVLELEEKNRLLKNKKGD